MIIDTNILLKGYDVIPYEEVQTLAEVVKRTYHFSAPEFWMVKMFQFGYVYGKRAERARRKKTA